MVAGSLTFLETRKYINCPAGLYRRQSREPEWRPATAHLNQGAKMKVQIMTSRVPGGWHPAQLDQFLGGNEETLVEFPRALAKTGHDVTIFTDLANADHYSEKHEGTARWLQMGKFQLADSDRDALVTFKDRGPWFRGAQAPRRIHWSQDIEHPWAHGVLSQVNSFVVLGTYHASRMPWVPDDKLLISPLGMTMPGESNVLKDPDLMIYTSSPDRGLNTLLQDWGRIKHHHPKLKLVVTYSWSNLDRWGGEGGQRLKAELMGLMGQTDIQKAELNREQMNGLMRAATYYCFPLNRSDSDLCGFGLQKAREAGCKLVLNYAQGNGFQDVAKDYIPYREFISGSTEEVANSSHRHDPTSWDDLVADFWNPLLNHEVPNAMPSM